MLCLLLASLLAATPAAGQYRTSARPEVMPAQPGESDVAKITDKTGTQLPLDLPFVDELGNRVTLGQYFAAEGGGTPVILTLNYFECPSLCGMMLNGLADAMRELKLELGKDYRVVTISFDPAEMPNLARSKKGSYVSYLGEGAGVVEGWHFLTGEQQNITAVSEAMGYHYAWVDAVRQWSHPNAIMLLDEDGKLFRYLYPTPPPGGGSTGGPGQGFFYDPRTLRLSLVESSRGEVGTIADQILLTCFAFDPHTGKYSRLAMGLMQAGGAATALLLVASIAGFLVWEKRRTAAGAATLGATDTDETTGTPRA